MYRRSVLSQPVKPNKESSPPATRISRKYDLLWRKKTSKVHKTWEGDAKGFVRSTANGYELVIYQDGLRMATLKIGPDLSIVNEGQIFSSDGYEFEVGAQLSSSPPQITQSTIVSSHVPLQVKSLKKSISVEKAGLAPKRSIEHRESISKNHTESTGVSATGLRSQSNLTKRSAGLQRRFFGARLPPLGMTAPFNSPMKRVCSADPRPDLDGPAPVDCILASKLRPHQLEGVEFMRDSVLGVRHNYGNGCILADEMGLGKTLTSIALLHTLLKHRYIKNALIVCPVSLVANWKKEFQKWLPASEQIRPKIGVMTIDQNGLGNGSLKDPANAFFGDRMFKTHQVMIVGYERVRLLSTQLTKNQKVFDMVICDEGHRLKTSGSKTAEAIASISDDKRVLLTGTPIQNDLVEFWAIADFVNPGCFGSEAKFRRKYASAISSHLTVRPSYSSHDCSDTDSEDGPSLSSARTQHQCSRELEASKAALVDLTEICEEFMLRRTASVIEKYLAIPKTEFVVFCRPTRNQALSYEALVGQASYLITGNSIEQGSCLQAISQLKKVAAGTQYESGGKMKVLSSLIDNICNETDEKVVIASGSTRVLDMCQNLCASKQIAWLRLDGSTAQDKRQSSVEIFNKTGRNRAFAFLLSTRSGGMGLNLVGGSRLILLDCDWNPAVDAQVMARIHRDGQKRPCFVYRLLTTGTIDEKIFQRQLSKIGLSENILLDAMNNNEASKADFSKDTLQDLFTITYPDKCNTLDTAARDSTLKGYMELDKIATTASHLDPVLGRVIDETKNISSILARIPPAPTN